MAEPVLVGECIAAMKRRSRLPVTVNAASGIDEQDPEERSDAFARAAEQAGVDASSCMRARRGSRLSPRENRDVRRSTTIGSIGSRPRIPASPWAQRRASRASISGGGAPAPADAS